MERVGVRHREKDPSLLPESQVRPWVVDKDAERQMEHLLDNLEKSMTFVSPVKDGLGVSPLDRTLRDDTRTDLLYTELAALEAQNKATAARSASRSCDLRPIAEVFEDAYREAHGLPLRRKLCVSKKSIAGDASSSGDMQEVGGAVAEAGEAPIDPLITDGARGELATDPDVARLLADLQKELDTDCRDSDGGKSKEQEEDGSDEDETATGKKNKQGLVSCAGCRQSNNTEQECGTDRRSVGSARSGHLTEGKAVEVGAQPDFDLTPSEHDRRATALTPVQDTSIDISRMKVDGVESRRRAGPRPRSAPSACGSRLSRTPSGSSRLARSVSQKVLEATKKAERASSKEQKAGGVPHLSGGSRIAQAGDKIHVVKQNADALQASMSVKRTSYLRTRRPRAVRWSPRYKDNGWHPKPVSKKERENPAKAAAGSVRQRPLTAGPRRRGPRLQVVGSSSTPLFNSAEQAFLFEEASDEAASQQPPSLRQTTLGRMLSRAASVTDSSSLGRSSEYSNSPSHRPSSAGADPWCGGSGAGSGGSYKQNQNSTTGGKTARSRPSSADPASRRRTAPATRSRTGNPSKELNTSRYAGGDGSLTSGGVSPSPKQRGYTLAPNSSARDHVRFVERATYVTGEADREQGKSRERGITRDRNVHKALEEVMKAAIGSVSPREQFVNARNTIAEMKQINTKDSTGDILLTTQGMSKARLAEECWSSETGRHY